MLFGKTGGDAEGAVWFRSGRIPLPATLSKAVLAIFTVGLGISLGRESPIKQAGGAIASTLSRWGGLSLAQQRLLAACGIGAGMASAYNVPLGGALFAIEVLLGTLSLQKIMPALAASVVATAASWLLLPIGPVYVVREFNTSIPMLPWAILTGPLFGLSAVVIVRAIGWAEGNQPTGWRAIALPIVVLTLLGVLAIWFPQLLGNGKDTVQLAFDNQKKRLTLGLFLLLPILKLIATAASLRAGARGGLFTPTMTVGALLGGGFGMLWSRILPGAAVESYAIAGSCAVLAAATRGPISSLVIVLELTRHVDATMVPMLLASTGAILTASRFETRSIYSARARP
jgi:H+/Cl- antiporter ClcA